MPTLAQIRKVNEASNLNFMDAKNGGLVVMIADSKLRKIEVRKTREVGRFWPVKVWTVWDKVGWHFL